MTKITEQNISEYAPIRFGHTLRKIKYQLEFHCDGYRMTENGEVTYYTKKDRVYARD
jgi:hypothetical protein